MYKFRPLLWPTSGRCHTNDTLQKLQEQMQKCKILTLKMYAIQYMSKYKMILKFTPRRTQWRNYIETVPPFGLPKMCASKYLIPNYIKITIARHNKQCNNTMKAKKKKCILYFDMYTVILKLHILHLSIGS